MPAGWCPRILTAMMRIFHVLFLFLFLFFFSGSVKDSRYLDAFKSNMANSKGRNFIQTMLTQFYDIENKAGNVIVENIGVAAKSSDAARFLHFHVSKREPDG